jgi:hypothetical protein
MEAICPLPSYEILKLTIKRRLGALSRGRKPCRYGFKGDNSLKFNLKVGKLWWVGPDWLSKSKVA